jgi:hypothetical protein
MKATVNTDRKVRPETEFHRVASVLTLQARIVRCARVVDHAILQFVTAIRITTQPWYFLVELVNIEPATAATEIESASVPANITEHVGRIVNAVWNEALTVCAIGLSPNVQGRSLAVVVHCQFGMVPARAATIAVPTESFLPAVEHLERERGLPLATLGGQWAKTSEDVRHGYLFIDLQENDVDEVIRWAKLGEFGYILVYAPTWATTLGSYPINPSCNANADCTARARRPTRKARKSPIWRSGMPTTSSTRVQT